MLVPKQGIKTKIQYFAQSLTHCFINPSFHVGNLSLTTTRTLSLSSPLFLTSSTSFHHAMLYFDIVFFWFVINKPNSLGIHLKLLSFHFLFNYQKGFIVCISWKCIAIVFVTFLLLNHFFPLPSQTERYFQPLLQLSLIFQTTPSFLLVALVFAVFQNSWLPHWKKRDPSKLFVRLKILFCVQLNFLFL